MVTETNFDKKNFMKASKKSFNHNHSMNERVKNSSLVNLKRNNDLEIKINKINKSKTNQLYLTSLRNKEKKEIIIKEYEKLKSENELKDCTFKPKVNNHYQSKRNNVVRIDKKSSFNNDNDKNQILSLDPGFLQRGNAWQNRKNEKYQPV